MTLQYFTHVPYFSVNTVLVDHALAANDGLARATVVFEDFVTVGWTHEIAPAAVHHLAPRALSDNLLTFFYGEDLHEALELEVNRQICRKIEKESQ